MMFGKVTDSARQVIEFTDGAHRALIRAQTEARLLNESQVTPEHLLLALVHATDSVAAQVLDSLEVAPDWVRFRVEEHLASSQQEVSPGHIPLDGDVKKALKSSQREALRLGHRYVGTEHILLGLIGGVGRSMAAQALVRMGADLDRVRQQVLQLHDESARRGLSMAQTSPSRSAEQWLSEQVLPGISAISVRLSALEGRVGAGAETSDIDRQIAHVRREMASAARARKYERAAELRESESRLLAQRTARQQEWESSHPKLPELTEACRQLNDEVDRLRALLYQQGIDPQDWTPGSNPAAYPRV